MENIMPLVLQYFVPSALFGASVYTDLKFKKVFNKFLLFSLILILALRFFQSGLSGLTQGFLASFLALALCLPLVMTKALGAGDMKLLMVYGFSTYLENVFWIVIYAFFWGALLGVLKALFEKQGQELFKNTFFILSQKKDQIKSLHTIPFTVAILLGWMSLISLS